MPRSPKQEGRGAASRTGRRKKKRDRRQPGSCHVRGCEQRGQSPGPRGAEMSSVRMDPGRGSRSPLSLPTLSRRQPRGPRSWPSGLHWAPSRPQEPSLTGKHRKEGPREVRPVRLCCGDYDPRMNCFLRGRLHASSFPQATCILTSAPALPLLSPEQTHDKNGKTCLGGVLTSGQPPVVPAPKPEERVKKFNNPLTGRWLDTWEDSGFCGWSQTSLIQNGFG